MPSNVKRTCPFQSSKTSWGILAILLSFLLAVPALSGDLHVVKMVIDGDTLLVGPRAKVRLIGVSAPEGKEPFGPKATECLREILADNRVRLEAGAEPRGRYRQLLAHVFTEEGTYVNAELLRRGCAKLMVIGLNTGHLDELVAAQTEAWEKGRGLWGGW